MNLGASGYTLEQTKLCVGELMREMYVLNGQRSDYVGMNRVRTRAGAAMVQEASQRVKEKTR